MQTEKLDEQVDQILEEVDKAPAATELEEPITDGEFIEPIEGEVIENPAKPKGIAIKWLIPIGLVSLALALIGVLVIAPLFAESATIIITPETQTITAKGEITLTAKTLVSRIITLSEQVKTTGVAHQAATQAHGWVTFYNALQSPQDIPPGTLLVGADGAHIIVDGDAYIPGGTLATNGSVTVPAHTAIIGTGGNIHAGDINGPCCREYVFAYNSTFTGGQDARDYKTATSSDINAARKELTSLITTQLTTDAQRQLAPNETMSLPLCQSKTTNTPNPGIEAAQVTVTVTSSCTVYSYNRLDVTTQEQALFTHAVSDQLGAGYTVKGNPTETITKSTINKGTVTVSVSLTGNCVYHFRSDEIHAMQQLVIGKSREQATQLLLHVRGVHTAGIQIENGKTTVPGNVKNIAVNVYEKG
jgi:hypothetical protein